MSASQDHSPPGPPPADLGHAGAVIDKAIDYMVGQNIDSVAIASSLLGGALGLLSRTVGDDAIVRILESALASVRTGDLRRMAGAGDDPASA